MFIYIPSFVIICHFLTGHFFTLFSLPYIHFVYAGSVSPGGFDKRLKENVEYLEELKGLAEIEGISDRVNFVTSCSTAERNTLLSDCLCVLYTPKVSTAFRLKGHASLGWSCYRHESVVLKCSCKY